MRKRLFFDGGGIGTRHGQTRNIGLLLSTSPNTKMKEKIFPLYFMRVDEI